ncbi:tRNA methyltransferase 10 homolog C [Scomber scombrus]|uniref:tRNA methyltransferase 10 homolog C n=1 Tax=Scomber scombrus TaxID=13677 RepID=A0AAV1P680_SCOSC
MLRLFTSRGFHELYKCIHVVASCVNKRQVVGFLPASSANILSRHFNTGSSVWKDALQPQAEQPGGRETLDLDKWKSVMRSQAASDEKQQDIEEEDEAGNDLKESSTLEATRELVVMWRQAGKLVPQEMTDEEVETVAKLTTKSSRKKYLKYLALREGHKRFRKEKQEKKKAEKEERLKKDDAEEGDDQGGQELKSTFLLQFWNRSLDRVLAWKSAQAMVFGQPLVFDMSYDSSMSRQEVENTVSQLMEVEGMNRRATEPYHLHLCNLQPDGAYKKELLKRYGAETWDRLLITSTERQHFDLFPREQLVYLTADSPNVLRTFDHSKVYIIGSIVDRSIQTGLSLANAKRLKLATARLPLDEFLHWGCGAKNLTLDQMIRIMLTMKETGKWEEALKFVPTRKHEGFYPQRAQREMSNNRVTSHGPREDGDRSLRSGERKSERMFKSGNHKDSGFTGRDRVSGLSNNNENRSAATRVRTSFKNNMEGRNSAGRGKTWWDNE